MKSNSKKGLIVLVVILSLLVVGLSSYLIYDKVLSNNEETKVNNNSIENIIDVEDAELVASLKEQVNNFELLSWKLKTGWFYENDKTLISELDNEKKFTCYKI